MRTFVILDLETTGLDAKNDRITEVAAMKIRENGEEVGQLHTMVKLPGRQKVPQKIVELTGITDADLVGGMQQRDAMVMLKRFCAGSTVVAQNAPFDLQFIAEKGKILPRYFACTRAMSKLTFPGERQHNLKAICQRLRIDLTGHHRAMNDVKATVEAFLMLKAAAEGAGIHYENRVIDFPDRPLKWIPFCAEVVKA